MTLARTLASAIMPLVALSLAMPGGALAQGSKLCVYDPMGKVGDYYSMLDAFSLQASSWGVELQAAAYTDEDTAVRDYEAGLCDGVLATGVRLQRFNSFPSTIEAIGALSSYDLLRDMVESLASYESAISRLRSGQHETVGFIPVGAVYLFVRDRSLDTVPELAGIRIATMDYDKASPVMVDRVGAIRVPADLRSIGPEFNNGSVDACYVSAAAYRPFELWRGLEPAGGIVRLPLAQATLQLMIRAPAFPDDFPANARAWFLQHFDQALALVTRAESDIPSKYWIPIPEESLPAFDDLFQGVRIYLRDQVGAYDATMLRAMRMLRCAAQPQRSECHELVE